MTYRRYAAERIGASLAMLFLAASLAYVIFHVVGPGGVQPHIDAGSADGPAQLARYHRYENESYGDFLWHLVGNGSLGRSIYGGEDVTSETFDLVPPTLSLAVGAVLFALFVGVPLGALWSRRPLLGRLVAKPFTYLALGIVPVWSGLLLSLYLGFHASLLPIAGYCNLLPQPHTCGGPVQWAYHLVLPWIVLGLALAAVYTGVTRRLILAVERAAKDSPEQRRVAARKARVALTKLGVRHAAWLVGATFLVESIFEIPGLGREIISASFYGDPTYGEAVLLAASIVAVGLALAVDLVVGALISDWRVNELRAGRPQDVPHWALT